MLICFQATILSRRKRRLLCCFCFRFGELYLWQNAAHVNLEDGLGHIESYVWSDVEQSSRKLLNCRGLYVCPYSQGCEA